MNFILSEVHQSMNAMGLVQSERGALHVTYFARDPLRSYFGQSH